MGQMAFHVLLNSLYAQLRALQATIAQLEAQYKVDLDESSAQRHLSPGGPGRAAAAAPDGREAQPGLGSYGGRREPSQPVLAVVPAANGDADDADVKEKARGSRRKQAHVSIGDAGISVQEIDSGRDEQEEEGGRRMRNNHNFNLNLELAEAWEKEHRKELAVGAQRSSTQFTFDVFAKTSFRAIAETTLKGKDDKPCFLQMLVLEPTSTLSLLWNVMEMTLLTWDLMTIPLGVFELPDSIVFVVMKFVSLIFWTSDVLLSFFKGYVTRGGEVEMAVGKVAKHYLKRRFIWDCMLASIEWINLLMEQVVAKSKYASSGRLLRFLRFSRLLKVGKMRRLVDNFLQRIHSNVVLTVISLTKVCLFVFVFTHLVACGWYAVCVSGKDDNSWTSGDNLGNVTLLYRYATSMQWAFSQLSFGSIDVFAVNEAERAYSVAVTCMCLMAFSWLVSSFVILMTRLQMLRKERREQEEQLRDFLCKHNVSWALRNRIWIFLQKSRAQPKKHVQLSYVELVKRLPKTVTLELRAEVFIPVLTTHPFFCTYAVSQADKYAMHHLMELHALQECVLDTEHELFADGEVATGMYFLIRGVAMYRVSHSKAMVLQNAIAAMQPGASDAGPPKRGTEGPQKRGTHRTPEGAEIAYRRAESFDADLGLALDDGSAAIRVSAGEWMSEPALWLKWRHMGYVLAKTHCELVSLDVDKFQRSMSQDLPEARKYARLYLSYAERHRDSMSDIFVDITYLRTMAQDIFEPPMTFEVSRCEPQVDTSMAKNEWSPADRRQWQRVWTSPYKEAHLLNRSALLSTMTLDMKHDAVLVYQTLFTPAAGTFCWHSEEERRMYDNRILFMKRLFLCFAVCGIAFSTEDNGEAVRPWPYPLASAICHGGRVLLRLNGVKWRDVITFLFFGAPTGWNWDDGPPSPMYTRRAASHGIRIQPATSKLVEVKLKTAAAFDRCHMGMDLPVGGVGNPAPAHRAGQLFVGPAGVPYKRARRKLAPNYMGNIQHGHLYVRWDDFGERPVTVLSVPMAPGESGESTRSTSTGGTSTMTAANSTAGQRDSASVKTSSQSLGEPLAPPLPPEHSWAPVLSIRTAEDLRRVLLEAGLDDAAGDYEAVSSLRRQLGGSRELTLERNGLGSLRCRGVLIFLVLEIHLDGGLKMALTHRGATAHLSGLDAGDAMELARRDSIDEDVGDEEGNGRASQVSPVVGSQRSSVTFQQSSYLEAQDDDYSRRVEDLRVMTMINRQQETWPTTVTRHCQQVLHLCEAAISKIIEGCHEQTEEVLLYPCHEAPSICGHHRAAVRNRLPLHYTALRLKSHIKEEDQHLFGAMMRPVFETTEDKVPIAGFGSFLGGLATVTREWEWRRLDQMHQVVGYHPPTERMGVLQLRQEMKPIGSLLLGVECCAPLRDDLWGYTHAMDGKSKVLSAFGKRKWRDYRKGGQDVPADYGAIRVTLNETRFLQLQELCADLELSTPSDPARDEAEREAEIFRALLSASDEGVAQILEDRLGCRRGLAKNHAATSGRSVVFDGISVHDGLSSLTIDPGDRTPL